MLQSNGSDRRPATRCNGGAGERGPLRAIPVNRGCSHSNRAVVKRGVGGVAFPSVRLHIALAKNFHAHSLIWISSQQWGPVRGDPLLLILQRRTEAGERHGLSGQCPRRVWGWTTISSMFQPSPVSNPSQAPSLQSFRHIGTMPTAWTFSRQHYRFNEFLPPRGRFPCIPYS